MGICHNHLCHAKNWAMHPIDTYVNHMTKSTMVLMQFPDTETKQIKTTPFFRLIISVEYLNTPYESIQAPNFG